MRGLGAKGLGFSGGCRVWDVGLWGFGGLGVWGFGGVEGFESLGDLE